MRKPNPILFLFLFLFTSVACSQAQILPDKWENIDSLVKQNKELDNVLNQLKSIRQKASRDKLPFEVARTYLYELSIADVRTEDSLYFKNSAFMDTILSQTGLYPELHWSLLLMKAKRLKGFTKRSLKFQRANYLRKDIPVNYAAYSNTQLDSIVQTCFDQAKRLAAGLHNIDAIEALWLLEEPLKFLLKPDLFDITSMEQIRLYANLYYPSTWITGKPLKEWMKLTQDEFIENVSSDSNILNQENTIIRLYKEWLLYYKESSEKKYFIEALLRKYIFDKYRYSEAGELDNAYENYLERIILSEYNSVKGYGLYELCALLKRQAQKYFSESSYNSIAISNVEFDTTYQYKAARAVKLYEDNQALLDSFYYLKHELSYLIRDIKATDITWTVENNIVPGKPVLAQVKFKNLDTLYWRIIRVTNAEYESFEMKHNKGKYNLISGYKKEQPDQRWLYELLQKQPFIDKQVVIPVRKDYNYHLTYEKVELQSAGKYVLLFSSKAIMDTAGYTGALFLDVSNIAVLNSDNRIYVLNRSDGKPLQGANVKAISRIQPFDKNKAPIVSVKKYIVNKQGYVITPGDTYSDLEINYKDDTLITSVNYTENKVPEDVYDKEEYDDLVEFYADNSFVQVFTDRSIYRPGQTVHYKVLFLTRDPKTGRYIVINKQNLSGKLFNNLYKKWMREEEPWIYLYDPFGKEMDSLKVRPNDYGSVSGSFQIPKAAATGEWSIESDMLDTEWSEGTFQVEEYKRPSYEVFIHNPKGELLPGDPFEFIIKIKSFAGASLNNVEIGYSVTRRGAVFSDNNKISQIDLIDTVGYTNAQGELTIAVNDSLVAMYALADSCKYDFQYSVEIEAIDETGESYDDEASITISNRPIIISLPSQSDFNLSDHSFLQISTAHKNSGTVARPTAIKIYRLADNKLLMNPAIKNADVWLYSTTDLNKWFPYFNFSKTYIHDDRTLVLDTTIHTGDANRLQLDTSLFSAGSYEIEVSVRENGILRGQYVKQIRLFDAARNQLPYSTFNFSYLPYNSGNPGEKIIYYYGSSGQSTYSIFHISYYTQKGQIKAQTFYAQQLSEKGLNEFVFDIPKIAIGSLKMVHIFMLNNQLYKNEKTIYINNEKEEKPEIVIEKYRAKMVPGSKETFSVSIKTKNENTAAELMTTLYDASLDKLAEHDWKSFLREAEPNYRFNIYVSWPSSINYTESESVFVPYSGEKYPDQRRNTLPLWWLKPDSIRFNNQDWGSVDDLLKKMPGMAFDQLAGSVAGLDVSTKNLESVVVTAYDVRKQMSTSSSIVIRGAASLSSYKQPLIILDGVPFEGDINSINPSLITAGLVLKGADATALYGARAAEGVLLLSTKGEIVLPEEKKEEITPRKNFSETAFFFPALHADKKGYYTFSFEMPESVTEWNWKMLAHTKKAQFAYVERKLVTQLPLMVQPNMPRFLYQGDQVVLQSRITNLDTSDMKGNITCIAEDAVTGEDLTNKLLTSNQLTFSLQKKSNTSSAFRISIPKTQLNPIKIIIAARSQYFADAEEHVIPVLSPATFVRSNIPIQLQNSIDTTLHLPLLPADAKAYGMGISIHPKPQSALINSLPYLANYSYDCAEQTFNKLLAYVTAWSVMRTDSLARVSFEKAKDVVINDKGGKLSLPDEVAQEAMPWLQMANKNNVQQRQLFNLLDTSKSAPVVQQFLNRLYKLQQADGGLSWFDGGKSDFYISCYVLNGFAQIYNSNKLISATVFDYKFWQFVSALVKYCDSKFDDVYKQNEYYSNQYLHTRGNWIGKYPIADSLYARLTNILEEKWKYADNYSLHNQALLILSTLQYSVKGNALYTKAIDQLQSIRQLAIEDDLNGIRWKSLADADDLAVTAEETITLLAEAFDKANMSVSKGVLKWLMQTKREHNWRTTKATAAVVNLLEKENKSVMDFSQTLQLRLSDTTIKVTNDLLSGSTLNFIPRKTLPPSVHITKQAQGNASGSLQLYYFSASPLDNNTGLRLSKQLYSFDNTGKKRNISENDTLHLGDVVQVMLTIESPKALSYVHINDKTVAAFEPVENSSGYEYNGFGYYKSVRDAGPQFFASFLPSGKHEIHYSVKVAHEGTFVAGPSVLQCMYTPELIAYGNSIKINSGK